MAVGIVERGLGIDPSSGVVDSMLTYLFEEAKKDPTLIDRGRFHPNTREYKTARDSVINEMMEAPDFKHLWDGINGTDDGAKFVQAARLGLWANITSKLRTKAKKSDDTNAADLADNQRSSRGRSVVKTDSGSAIRSASATSNASASTVGASQFSKLKIRATPANIPLYATNEDFRETRVNVFVLGEDEKCFSFRLSSVFNPAQDDIVLGREDGILPSFALDFGRFRQVVDENLKVISDNDIVIGKYRVYHPAEDGPRAILTGIGRRVCEARQLEHRYRPRSAKGERWYVSLSFLDDCSCILLSKSSSLLHLGCANCITQLMTLLPFARHSTPAASNPILMQCGSDGQTAERVPARQLLDLVALAVGLAVCFVVTTNRYEEF